MIVSCMIKWPCVAMHIRFQSEVEPAFTVFEGSLLDGELSEMLSRIEGVARPLVGLRTQSTEDWWSYPMVVVYLAIDTSIEGRSGKDTNKCLA